MTSLDCWHSRAESAAGTTGLTWGHGCSCSGTAFDWSCYTRLLGRLASRNLTAELCEYSSHSSPPLVLALDTAKDGFGAGSPSVKERPAVALALLCLPGLIMELPRSEGLRPRTESLRRTYLRDRKPRVAQYLRHVIALSPNSSHSGLPKCFVVGKIPLYFLG